MGLQWNAICLNNVTNGGDNVDKNVTLTAFVILWLGFIPVHTEPPRTLQTPIFTDLQKHPENNKSVETSHITQFTKARRPHGPFNTSCPVSYGGISATLTHFICAKMTHFKI